MGDRLPWYHEARPPLFTSEKVTPLFTSEKVEVKQGPGCPELFLSSLFRSCCVCSYACVGFGPGFVLSLAMLRVCVCVACYLRIRRVEVKR